MSLPHWLGPSSGGFGAGSLPLLFPDADRVRRWRAALPAGPRIAIAWQGNPKGNVDKGRSPPLRCFAPLAAVPGVRLINLQKNDGLDQLASLPEGMTWSSGWEKEDMGAQEQSQVLGEAEKPRDIPF